MMIIIYPRKSIGLLLFVQADVIVREALTSLRLILWPHLAVQASEH